ncbi:hypothetical protein G6F57_016923 [Rhizopus arrhizus]|nr:hypothetical protein G6F57_016923 [Rhizopus arrhizus]
MLSDDPILRERPKQAGRRRAARSAIRRPGGPRERGSKKLLAQIEALELHEWDHAYGLPVLRGQEVVGRLTYLAVARHYQDLLDGHERGLEFSPGHAWHVIDYIEQNFVHIRGPLARQPILLDPWQKFWTAVLYGWLRADGLRRFRTGYEEVARKNGKSTPGPSPGRHWTTSGAGHGGPAAWSVASRSTTARTRNRFRTTVRCSNRCLRMRNRWTA